jgi:hypothetical protein
MADALSDTQHEALAAVHDRTHVRGAQQAYLGHLREAPYYVDGRTLSGLVRRGFLERREPEPGPFIEPSYVLTEAGIAMVTS